MDMHDQGIKRWATLYLKDALYGILIKNVRRETVHGFGRYCHQFALAQESLALFNIRGNCRTHNRKDNSGFGIFAALRSYDAKNSLPSHL